MPPRDSTVRATVRVMSSALNTSQVMTSAWPPRVAIVLAVSAIFTSVRPATATTTPACASAKAMPCPTPWPAPVTRATLPLRLAIGFNPCAGRRHAREPMRRQLRRRLEGLDFLVEPLVNGLADAPLPLDLHVLVAVQRAAGRAHLLGKIDEHVGQVPQTGGGRVGEHVDLRVMSGVTAHGVGVE